MLLPCSSATWRKKVRKPNWNDLEMEVLAEAYADSSKIIRGKLSPVLTTDSKKKAWEAITNKINAVSPCIRTVEEAKKRIQDVQSYLKKKEAFRRR